MKNKNIKQSIPAIDLADKVKALRIIVDNHNLSEVPVLEGSNYVGLLNVDSVQKLDDHLPLKDIKHLMRYICLDENYTIFDWLKLVTDFSLKNIPIIQFQDSKYLGSVATEDIIEKFKDTGLIVDLTSIVVLRKNTEDFKYSEVFQIAEANGAKVFGSYVEQSSAEFTDIVLNLHHLGLNELLQSFRRYEYDVVSYHDEDQHHETLKANSDYFSKYLTV